MTRSPACRGRDRVPLAAIAAMCGRPRLTLYRVLWSGRVSAELAEALTPIVLAFEAGRLRFKRSGPRSRFPNHWECSLS